jgi:signal transduction histidine kinase
MQTAPQLMLLHGNGNTVLTAPRGGNTSRRFMVELQDKIARVGGGDLDVTVGFATRNDGIGNLGRSFNYMVQQLRESRDEIERLHCNQLARAEEFATLGELATGLAHEIRNPLAGIAGVIEIVGRDLPGTSPARAVVKDVRLEIAQITRILTDLLQIGRPHPPEVRPSELNTTVEHTVRLARQHVLSRPIKIELQKDPNLPNVEHDIGQIHQLFLNLLLNAVQSIEGTGAVRVEISSLKGDAAIVVIDTGRGIAPEHLPNIFRPFFTTKRGGTGLGLSLARRIVEEHHGRIEVTSEVGKGTTFLVVLPLRQPT